MSQEAVFPVDNNHWTVEKTENWSRGAKRLRQLHTLVSSLLGVLTLIAWMLTGSVGTFIASFYKPEWPEKTLLGQKIWFQVHRGLMTLTVALTVAAFCLPFVYRKGWSKVQERTEL